MKKDKGAQAPSPAAKSTTGQAQVRDGKAKGRDRSNVGTGQGREVTGHAPRDEIPR
jgi:hypothetical protein